MSLRFSQSDYMADKLHQAFMDVRYKDDVPVSVVAEVSGLSESQIYTWSNRDEFDKAKAKHLWTMARGLAERIRNYRMIQALLPVGDRIVTSSETPAADGRIEDEVADGTVLLGQVAMAFRGGDADGLRRACEGLQALTRRIDQEGAGLRETTNG